MKKCFQKTWYRNVIIALDEISRFILKVFNNIFFLNSKWSKSVNFCEILKTWQTFEVEKKIRNINICQNV